MIGNSNIVNHHYKGLTYSVADVDRGYCFNGSPASNVPIYAVTQNHIDSFSIEPKFSLIYQSLDLGSFLAFSIKDVLSHEESDFLANFSRHLGFREEAPGIYTPPGMRLNRAVHWIASESMMQQLCDIISDFVPKVIDGCTFANCLSHRLNCYQYLGTSHMFTSHIDGDWPGYYYDPATKSVRLWEGLTSKLSMLLYLTDHAYPSGSTRLYNGTSY